MKAADPFILAMSYCDTEFEQQKNPEARDLMRLIANGNSDAFQWMWSFWSFTHLIDDCVDKDVKVTSSQASNSLAEFVTSLSQNPFFLLNRSYLYPLIISACSRWEIGDDLENGTMEDKVRSQVVRCGDIDIYLGVAFILGGYNHMQECAKKCRSYDLNNMKN